LRGGKRIGHVAYSGKSVTINSASKWNDFNHPEIYDIDEAEAGQVSKTEWLLKCGKLHCFAQMVFVQ
jgi:hypothetical protein